MDFGPNSVGFPSIVRRTSPDLWLAGSGPGWAGRLPAVWLAARDELRDVDGQVARARFEALRGTGAAVGGTPYGGGGPARRPELGAPRAVLATAAAVEARGDHGDPHLVGERLVEVRAEDDVGVGVGGLLDHLR